VRAGSGGGGGPTPLIVSDFKSGTYSIGGVSKTLGQVWEENVDYGPFDPALVVGGTGLIATGTGAFVNTGPVLTPTASTGLLPSDGGFTALVYARLDFTPAGDNGSSTLTVQSTDLPDFSAGWQMLAEKSVTQGDSAIIADYDSLSEPFIGVDFSANQLVKFAFTFTPTAVAGSMNDAAVITGAAPMSNVAANVIGLSLVIAANNDPADTGSITVEYVAFYEPVANADLPTLSA
jgi:hypothetical protein